MVLVEGVKYSCTPCIKGHRSANCIHPDRPLTEIKKKGRPPSQCPTCREARKSKSVHSKCDCPRPQPSKIPASASRLAHTLAPTSPAPAPTLAPTFADRPPSASPPLDFPFELPSPSPADAFFLPSLRQALSSSASLHSSSTSPPSLPRAQSSQSSFADPDTPADLGRRKSAASKRRPAKPHELSHGHHSTSGSARASPYPYPSSWASGSQVSVGTGWGEFDLGGLVTPPPSLLSDYSDSAASGSQFSLSSFGGDDPAEPDLDLAHALDRELNHSSGQTLPQAHSSALYRSLEHSLQLDPSLARELSSFALPPNSTFAPSYTHPLRPPSVSFPAAGLPTPTVSFPSSTLSHSRSREVAFAPKPSLALDRDRDRTLDASLGLDRDRDRTLGRELSLDRERDLTFKSTSTGASAKRGFKNLVSRVKQWGSSTKKGKEKQLPRLADGREAIEGLEDFLDPPKVKEELEEERAQAENGPSPEGARSIEELLWETIDEVEEVKPGGSASPIADLYRAPPSTTDSPDYYATLNSVDRWRHEQANPPSTFVFASGAAPDGELDFDTLFATSATTSSAYASDPYTFLSQAPSPPSSYSLDFRDPQSFTTSPYTNPLAASPYLAASPPSDFFAGTTWDGHGTLDLAQDEHDLFARFGLLGRDADGDAEMQVGSPA